MHTGRKKMTFLYTIVTFLVSWTCWGALVFLRLPAKESFLAITLLILGGNAPALVALSLPFLLASGERKDYYRRFFRFAIPAKWYIVSIGTVLLMLLIPYGINAVLFTEAVTAMTFEPLPMLLPLFLFMTFAGGGLEEFGWRGLLVETLKEKNPTLIALGVGVAVFAVLTYGLPGCLRKKRSG